MLGLQRPAPARQLSAKPRNGVAYRVLAGSVGRLHIPGRTYHVDQFFLEDLIEARMRTALAAAAEGRTSAANFTSSSSSGGLAGVLQVSAAAGREAARRGSSMPYEARITEGGGGGNPRFAPTLQDWERHLRGYLVGAAGWLVYTCVHFWVATQC
jgi:hypothetical protein